MTGEGLHAMKEEGCGVGRVVLGKEVAAGVLLRCSWCWEVSTTTAATVRAGGGGGGERGLKRLGDDSRLVESDDGKPTLGPRVLI